MREADGILYPEQITFLHDVNARPQKVPLHGTADHRLKGMIARAYTASQMQRRYPSRQIDQNGKELLVYCHTSIKVPGLILGLKIIAGGT